MRRFGNNTLIADEVEHTCKQASDATYRAQILLTNWQMLYFRVSDGIWQPLHPEKDIKAEFRGISHPFPTNFDTYETRSAVPRKATAIRDDNALRALRFSTNILREGRFCDMELPEETFVFQRKYWKRKRKGYSTRGSKIICAEMRGFHFDENWEILRTDFYSGALFASEKMVYSS